MTDNLNLDTIKSNFYTKFNILKKTRNSFLKLFRKKLEEKRIEQIKNNLSL